jgi:hypothetical protein
MTEALVVFWLLKELIISERGKAFCQVPPGTVYHAVLVL